VDNDRGLTRVMVVLCNRVHGVVGVGPFLVDTLHSAVAYGAAIVPGNFRTHWNRLERSFLPCSHDASPAWVSKSALAHDFIGSVHDFVRVVKDRSPIRPPARRSAFAMIDGLEQEVHRLDAKATAGPNLVGLRDAFTLL
jgi:hypothetical protein